MSFAVGDVVQLKSGGPSMTVESSGKRVKCLWFTNGERRSESFPAATLQIHQATKKAPAPTKRCACNHPLRGHSPGGLCLHRAASGEPCRGKCQIIEDSGRV